MARNLVLKLQVSASFGGVALGFALLALVVAMILWSIVRFVFRIPTLMSLTARMRRRNKGFAALSRGMVAASAGDAKTAARAARDAASRGPSGRRGGWRPAMSGTGKHRSR